MNIDQLARQQYGLVTRRQLLDLGISSSSIGRALGSGLERVDLFQRAAIYRLPGTPDSWHQGLMALLLWLGDESAISHRAAAALFGLGKFEPGTFEAITTLQIRHAPSTDIVIHNTDLLLPTYMTEIAGLRVTTVERTIFDLGAVVPRWKVAKALDQALFLKLTNLGELKGYLDELSARGRSGAGVLRQLLAERDPLNEKVDTRGELRVLNAIRKAGLPMPVAQYPIYDGPYELFRLDFAYPEAKIAIEVDDFPSHSTKSVFESDRRRDNFLQARGWRLLRITDDEIRDRPAEFLNRLRTLLGPVLLRGAPGNRA